MRITESQLRYLIGKKLAFMIENNLSYDELTLESQDKDDDGDNDFDDVRIARYIKGGMTKDQALAKVKKKSMGKNEST